MNKYIQDHKFNDIIQWMFIFKSSIARKRKLVFFYMEILNLGMYPWLRIEIVSRNPGWIIIGNTYQPILRLTQVSAHISIQYTHLKKAFLLTKNYGYQ